MLSGRSPFLQHTAADTAAAVLRSPPPDLAGAVKGLAPQLEAIVIRCLEKSPENRFQSARDLAHDLGAIPAQASAKHAAPPVAMRRTWAIGVGLAAVAVLAAAWMLVFRVGAPGHETQRTVAPTIVVLPFENMGSPDDEYFAAGMAEEITTRLANVQGLGVISRTSAVQYDRRGKSIKQIGADLGVDYVLEGSVRWERDAGHESRVRITPQLIRVADDTHAWAGRYDRVLADVFAIQSDVAENAVKAMGVALLPRERAALNDVSTSDLEAYDLYLRGQELASGGEDRRHVEGALQMYQAAVDRDPRFARALAGLAQQHLLMYWFHHDHRQERLTKAKAAAETAVELRPDLADTHIARGYYFYQGLLDFPRALDEFAAALRIQPNSSEANFGIGLVLRRQGRWAEAAEAMGDGLASDPKNATLLYNHGETCYLARRYADADRALGLAIALSPFGTEAFGRRAWLQVQWKGDVEKAQEILDEAGRVAGSPDLFAEVCGVWALRVATVRREYSTALRLLDESRGRPVDANLGFRPVSLMRGQTQLSAGQEEARRSFTEARRELEEAIARDPDDDRFHSSLGIACAGLGLRAEAVREAKLGCDLMPGSKDAWRAIRRLEDLAVVYTMVGMPAEAISTLDDLLAASGELTVHVLRLDPRWDALRSDSRFQALLTKYEVKD
jgi:serine/threonine-protein kinase